jgi:hypothetical protein
LNSRRPILLIGASALGVALVVFSWLWASVRVARVEGRAVAEALANHVRPPAEVARAVRALKLVSVELDTKVKVERGEASWRGDVKALVEVPVRLHYGVDLSSMDVSRVSLSQVGAPGGALYVVRLPRPTRLATEVFSEREQAEVETGWLRMRSRSGEYYLGQARRDAPKEARELHLLPQDQEKVESLTREQVERLVRAVVGEGTGVLVQFDSTLEPAMEDAHASSPEQTP